MPSGAESLVYALGPFRLLPKRQILLRQGKPVHLGHKALEILTVLVSRHGEVVSKEELTRRVWPSTFVHESNLKVDIATLRKALGEDDPVGPYIVNVRRRGAELPDAEGIHLI